VDAAWKAALPDFLIRRRIIVANNKMRTG